MLVAAESYRRDKTQSVKTVRKKLCAPADVFSSMTQRTADGGVLFLRRFNLRFFLLFPLFIILSSLFIFFWWQDASRPPESAKEEAQRFVIPKGQTASRVAARLEEEGLIKSALSFRLYTQVTGQAKAVQAGDYRLSPNLSLTRLVAALLAGPQELWVTYPEGLRREEMAVKTIKTLGMEGETAEMFYEDFLKESRDLEGFLFPETYLFAPDVKASNVVKKLRAIFAAKVTEKMIEDAKDNGLQLNEVVILASIVERETLTDDERPVVAGILLRRMEIGMPLQADATLQYITGNKRCTGYQLDCDWWEPPTVEDKKLNSPYNTYLNKGLPPEPIANPGLQSIKAVIYPQESSYLYYIHDKDGKIHYAETIEEHNENVARYIR